MPITNKVDLHKQESLFSDFGASVKLCDIETEGIKYIGSKKEILPRILMILELLKKQISVSDVLDGFSGSTRVTQALAKSGFNVVSNDTAVYSKIFAECYLMTKKDAGYYKEKINKLNNLHGKDGWFTEQYGGAENDGLSGGNREYLIVIDKHGNLNLKEVEKELTSVSF